MSTNRTFVRAAAPLLAIGVALAVFQNCSKASFSQVEASSNAAPLCVDVSQNVNPVVEWDWQSQVAAADSPNYKQVMAAPAVSDLDQDGQPEVVFVSWSTDYQALGVLRVIDGRSGRPKFSVSDPNLAPYAATTPLLVDLDGDGKLEIIYVHGLRTKIVALNFDGSLRWIWDLPAGEQFQDCFAGLSTADLDGNGRAEVLGGSYVVEENANRLPVLKATLAQSTGYRQCGVFATVLNPAKPEFSIVDSAAVYDKAGQLRFTIATGSGGYMAAGKVRADLPGSQIIKTALQHLVILDGQTGQTLTDVDMAKLSPSLCASGKIGGGPASIGDFTGDGTLQIAVATGQNIMVFDGFGKLIASSRTQDCSSMSTGVTAFDFDGDGKPEIAYNDEQYLRIYHVVNGQLQILAQIVNPTGTLLEYPVVADLTGDGSARLLMVSNNYAVDGLFGADRAADREIARKITGIRAFKSGDGKPWMPTRASWGQYHYNASLVDDRGRVNDPAVASQLYLGSTFKVNGLPTTNQVRCRR